MRRLCLCPFVSEVDAESPVVRPTGVCRGGKFNAAEMGEAGKGRKSRETRAGPGCEGPGNMGTVMF